MDNSSNTIRNKPTLTPKDFFLWAGAMVALYVSIVSLVALLFEYVDRAFPDPLQYWVDPYGGGIRFAMASLIVLFPVFLFLMRLIRTDIARSPEKKDLWVRRWALYLTVFIAGAAIVTTLITLINSFLGGDLTGRFILKVLVVLFVASAGLAHFLADIWGYWARFPQRAQYVGYIVGVLILGTIISGFFIMGTPGEIRLLRFDEQKISDLQNIQWQVVNYWQQTRRLPASLAQLHDPLSGYTVPADPQTGQEYIYETIGPLAFKLCAEFNRESQPQPGVPPRPVSAIPNEVKIGETWEHGVGKVCFERAIDPERYPPFPR